jgi:hypothetical protein
VIWQRRNSIHQSERILSRTSQFRAQIFLRTSASGDNLPQALILVQFPIRGIQDLRPRLLLYVIHV